MAELNKSNNRVRRVADTSTTIPISDIFFLTLRHWPWIILSVLICVGFTYLYLLRTPNVYTRAAEIIIKDDSKGQSTAGEEFANLGLFQSNTNIQNEMTNIKSKDLMEEVVKRLSLDVNYYKSGSFHDVVAYGFDLPVKIDLFDFPADGSFSLNLAVKPDGEVQIKDLEIPGQDDYRETYTGQLNDTIQTPIGNVMVIPTASFQQDELVSLIVRKIPVSAARDSYNARLGVSLNEKSSVIKLTMADHSVQRADDVLTTLIGVYNENWIRDRNQISVSTSNFINERLGVIEHELGNVDSDISSYKSANLVPNFDAAASMYMSQSQATQAQIQDVNNQLSMARYIRSYLTADNNREQLLPMNTGLQSSSIQSLIGTYNEKLLQRNSLVNKSSEKNPLVIQLDEQLDAQRQAMIRTIDNEIIGLNTLMKSLKGTEAQTMSHLASNPTQAKNLLSTERQQKVKESLYLFLLQKREENELSQAFTAYNTRIVNKPGASGIPVTPNRKNMLLMAFVVGLAIPFGVTFVKEITNTKLRGRKDIEHLAIPFLGEIPQYSAGKNRKGVSSESHTLLVKAGKRDIINEAFRVLRTNVEFVCNSEHGANVIALTSFNPGSGKSFISANLAMSIALKDKRVLLIDGDMRHGSASSYINSPAIGLSDYLSGSFADADPLIVRTEFCDNFYVFPIGTIPPNPTELLESPRFAAMIRELRNEFDYIIIDCPPIEVVADAQIIDKHVDRTFFIARSGLLERSIIPELDRLYEDKKYKNMAFILNGTRNEQGRYGYNHSYRYGYGYGYGYGYNYGSDGKKKRKG